MGSILYVARETRGRLAGALVLGAVVVCVALDLRLQPGGEHITRAVDDVSQLVAAATAAGTCAFRARRSTANNRASWALLAAAAAAWAGGEVVWSYYELIAGHETPFPSIADAGFLAFPVLALIAVFVRRSSVFSGQGRLRLGLDGLLVAGSIALVSWATALGEVARAGGSTTFAFLVSLAYPVTDIVLLTVTVVVMANARGAARKGMTGLGIALAVMAVADSGFAYLVVTGAYSTGNLVDAGWIAALLLLALAAARNVDDDQEQPGESVSLLSVVLPYAFPLLAIGVAVQQLLFKEDRVILLMATLVVVVLFARQLLALLDNRRLVQSSRHQAFHDHLTGLANRALFSDRVTHAVALHARDLRPVAVIYLDLDDFKSVNDTLGHTAGDELLVRISERLTQTVRTGDTVARLGGDEFAVLTEAGGDASMLARRLLDMFAKPVYVAEHRLDVRASIGIASLVPEGTPVTGEELLKRADIAMYAAKRMGKKAAVHFSPDLPEVGNDELELRAGISDAVASNEITVAYEPIFAADGALCGYEALARWSHQGEEVAPGRLIPAAHRAGVLAALDEAVLEQGLDRATSWPPGTVLHVNVSVDLLSDTAFPERLMRTLAAHRFPAGRLVVEVLESERIEQASAVNDCLGRLRNLGVRVALDDFGVGFSSLSRLQSLPVDVIKIDRSFVSPLDDPMYSSTCLAGIVDLAHSLGATVTADGVETIQQLRRVLEVGCDSAQGYLLGSPAAATSPLPPQSLPWVGARSLSNPPTVGQTSLA